MGVDTGVLINVGALQCCISNAYVPCKETPVTYSDHESVQVGCDCYKETDPGQLVLHFAQSLSQAIFLSRYAFHSFFHGTCVGRILACEQRDVQLSCR